MDDKTRNELLRQYRDGHAAVVSALAGITAAELDRRSSPDEWTAREVAHHLADSEMTSAIRLRRLLAEENPQIFGYDEDLFRRKLRYDSRPIEAALEVFRLARETTAQILEGAVPGDWLRAGTHSESGAYSVETWLEIYARHAMDHAEQIRRARGTA